MKGSFIIISIILTSAQFAVGQIVYEWENQAENYYYRVKNIEFFIDRFNNQPEGSGRTQTQTQPDSNSQKHFLSDRDNTIFSLFDLQRLNKKDEKLKQRINAFFLKVNNVNDPLFLNFTDNHWFAELLLSIRYQNQETMLQCILQVKQLSHGEYGWSIQSFIAPELGIKDHIPGNMITFPPNVNGTDFMTVKLALSNPEWVNAQIDSAMNSSSILLQKLKAKEITIESVKQITYHFLPIEGWGFTVRYVNRESKNSGWLIEQLFELTNEEKALYRKRYLID